MSNFEEIITRKNVKHVYVLLLQSFLVIIINFELQLNYTINQITLQKVITELHFIPIDIIIHVAPFLKNNEKCFTIPLNTNWEWNLQKTFNDTIHPTSEIRNEDDFYFSTYLIDLNIDPVVVKKN